MYYSVWFTKPHTLGDCCLISGVTETTAERLAEALNLEFPECKFWAD